MNTRIFHFLALVCLLSGCGSEKTEPPRVARKARPPKSVPAIELSRDRLMTGARLGGDYLVRMLRENGKFNYNYDAATDTVRPGEYNIVRHAGTTFSLFELYAATRETNYLQAANLAVDFLKTRFKPATESNAVFVLDYDGKAKLGANGLALLALARQIALDPASADYTNALHLANHILGMQEEDGSFRSYYAVSGEDLDDSYSLYYPGEAILGLVEFYKTSPLEARLLEAARRGADYLIQSQKEMPELPPDAWLMQALEALFKFHPDPKYFDHALALAENMISQQYGGPDVPDRVVGGYGPGEPRATPAACRSEGIVAVYRMARAQNHPKAPKLADSLKAAARFQLWHQLTEEDASWLPAPEQALGGVRGSLSSTRIRIDYVQHNISAFLGLAQAWDSLPPPSDSQAPAGE